MNPPNQIFPKGVAKIYTFSSTANIFLFLALERPEMRIYLFFAFPSSGVAAGTLKSSFQSKDQIIDSTCRR